MTEENLTIQPSDETKSAQVYLYSLKRRYPKLSLQTMMAVMKEPARLCHHGLLIAVSKQHPKTQKLIFDLYTKGIRGGEESEEAAIKIISCTNQKLMIFPLISGAILDGEFISAYEMANIYDQLPKGNLSQVKDILSEGLVKAANKASLILSQTSNINFDSKEIKDFYKEETKNVTDSIKKEVDKIASSFLGKGKYRLNLYQSAIAMKMLDDPSKFVACQLMSGNGKTLIIMKLVNYYSR